MESLAVIVGILGSLAFFVVLFMWGSDWEPIELWIAHRERMAQIKAGRPERVEEVG